MSSDRRLGRRHLTASPADHPLPAAAPFASLSDNETYKDLGEIGLLVGGYASLGAVVGLAAGSIAKSIWPEEDIDLADWVQLGATLLALFSLSVEVFSRIGI